MRKMRNNHQGLLDKLAGSSLIPAEENLFVNCVSKETQALAAQASRKLETAKHRGHTARATMSIPSIFLLPN